MSFKSKYIQLEAEQKQGIVHTHQKGFLFPRRFVYQEIYAHLLVSGSSSRVYKEEVKKMQVRGKTDILEPEIAEQVCSIKTKELQTRKN